jgi:hypothetical protein
VTGQGVAILGGAIVFTVSGLFFWFVDRRKGRPAIALALLLLVPGVYLTGLTFFGAPRWLLAPGIAFLAAGYLVQSRGRRH